jgi:antirestriction protein ArdC
MSQTPEQQSEQQPARKNRFSISREAHEEYVTDMADTMNKLTGKIKAGDKPASVSPPFCPTTGFAYGGASMTRLMLASVEHGYEDERWLTFKQLQNYKFESKNFKAKVKKGQHGVKLLRSEDVHFVVDKEGKWEFLEESQAKELRKQGVEVQHKTLFYPYTVFNASQLENFPPKENPAPAMNAEERNAAIDKFVACLGVKQEYGHAKPGYNGDKDTIQLPDPATFKSPDEFYAMKLRLAFHATAHNDRERREPGEFEAMRGETFSLLAGARFGLPMPVNGGAWPDTFQGGDKWRAMEAAADASKMLSVLEQFSRGEEPKADWFPKKTEWPAMIAAQESPAASAPVAGLKLK